MIYYEYLHLGKIRQAAVYIVQNIDNWTYCVYNRRDDCIEYKAAKREFCQAWIDAKIKDFGQ